MSWFDRIRQRFLEDKRHHYVLALMRPDALAHLVDDLRRCNRRIDVALALSRRRDRALWFRAE